MNPMHQNRAFRLWSAATRHRLFRFGDLSPKRGRVQRPVKQFRRDPLHSTATSPLPKARTCPRTPKRCAQCRGARLCPQDQSQRVKQGEALSTILGMWVLICLLRLMLRTQPRSI